MKALVTGGAGFIGSHLVDRLLAEGHSVDVIDNLSSGSLANLGEARAGYGHALHFHDIDIRSPDVVGLVAKSKAEVVFHLAAQIDVRVSIADPVLDADVNVLGTLKVLEGCRAGGTRKIVFAASGGTLYGEVPEKKLPVKESVAHKPLSPYGISKKAVVDYLEAYRQLHSLEYSALALGNVYGPRQDPHGEAGVVAIFAGALLSGQACTIFGDGTQTRDFIFVDDVVDAFSRAAGKGDGLLMNIGTGTEVSVNEIYVALADAAGLDLPAAYAPARPGELQRNALDPSKAKIHLKWVPWTTLDDGCRQVIAYTRTQREGAR